MYTLIITNKNYSSWSLRPWVLMRERSIPFVESLVPMGDEPGRVTLHDVSPTGKVPCLVDGPLDSVVTRFPAKAQGSVCGLQPEMIRRF